MIKCETEKHFSSAFTFDQDCNFSSFHKLNYFKKGLKIRF